MRTALYFTIGLIVFSHSANAKNDFNIYESNYYGHYINLLNLKPLTLTDGSLSLRMVWLRSFHDPVIITMSCWEECTIVTHLFDFDDHSIVTKYESVMGRDASWSFVQFADTMRSYEYAHGRCGPSGGFCLSMDGSSSGIELMVGSSKTFMDVRNLGRNHESLEMFIHRVVKSADVDFAHIY